MPARSAFSLARALLLCAPALSAGSEVSDGPAAPPPPPTIFSHLEEEEYTGTVDCDRGTIRSDATAAGLPTGTESYTVLLEFNCTTVPSGPGVLYSWGESGSVNALYLSSTLLHHYWWDNDLSWTFSDSGMSSSDFCDGSWHTVGTQFDGTTRRIFFDGATVASDTPSGSHATINTNFCLGAPGTVDQDAFSGTIRSLEVYASGSIAATTPPACEASAVSPWITVNSPWVRSGDHVLIPETESVGDAYVEVPIRCSTEASIQIRFELWAANGQTDSAFLSMLPNSPSSYLWHICWSACNMNDFTYDVGGSSGTSNPPAWTGSTAVGLNTFRIGGRENGLKIRTLVLATGCDVCGFDVA